MKSFDDLLTSRQGPWIAGGVIGLVAVALAYLGNPGNMGFCVACFTRDIAGVLKFHNAPVVQYIRPEITGFILGSFLSAFLFREYSPRGGSSPLVRFGLGVFAMLGALVFLGCPWRAYLRVAGGDWNALYGVGGLVVGLFTGDVGLVGRAMKDVVAEPYRKQFIPGFDDLREKSLSAGAMAFNISGSGPSVFALSGSRETAVRAGALMREHFTALGIGCNLYVTKVAAQGARVLAQ